jgi:hypothetical protein
MNYFNKVYTLSERRLQQLEKEEKFDEILKESSKICPNTINNFLLLSRRYNRILSKETYTLGVFTVFDKITDNLDKFDIFYEKYKSRCPKQLCKNLQEFINREIG